MTTSYDRVFAEGTRITGKWNGNKYTLEKMLGEGANGRVYLVRAANGRRYAMKLGFDPLDHQSEVNVLKKLGSFGSKGKRFLVEADDFAYEEAHYPFYVMRYIEGERLPEFLSKRGGAWLLLLGRKILRKLSELHETGYVFGDLKPDNLIVTPSGDVELIDFGGVTKKGNGVKQYTELYDRGFWGLGSRTAEPSYDLFSFATLCIHLADPQRGIERSAKTIPQNRGLDMLQEAMSRSSLCTYMKPVLQKCLDGKYRDARTALAEWRTIAYRESHRIGLPKPNLPWLKPVFIGSIVMLISTIVLIVR